MEEFTSILGLKYVFQDDFGTRQSKSLYFITKRQWKNQQSNMIEGFNTQSYEQP